MSFLRRISSVLREHFKTVTRSGEWPKVRDLHLRVQPQCAACGGKSFLQVHHIRPFHIKPELELDPKNLITLCMGQFECHFTVGHGLTWRTWNTAVVKDAALLLRNPTIRDSCYKEIKKSCNRDD